MSTWFTWSMHGIFLASSNSVKRITQLHTVTKAVTNFKGKIVYLTPKKKSCLHPLLFVRTLPLIIRFLHISSSSSWNWDLSFCSLSINFQAFGAANSRNLKFHLRQRSFCGKLERREFEFLMCSLENERAVEFPHTIGPTDGCRSYGSFLKRELDFLRW